MDRRIGSRWCGSNDIVGLLQQSHSYLEWKFGNVEVFLHGRRIGSWWHHRLQQPLLLNLAKVIGFTMLPVTMLNGESPSYMMVSYCGNSTRLGPCFNKSSVATSVRNKPWDLWLFPHFLDSFYAYMSSATRFLVVLIQYFLLFKLLEIIGLS